MTTRIEGAIAAINEKNAVYAAKKAAEPNADRQITIWWHIWHQRDLIQTGLEALAPAIRRAAQDGGCKPPRKGIQIGETYYGRRLYAGTRGDLFACSGGKQIRPDDYTWGDIEHYVDEDVLHWYDIAILLIDAMTDPQDIRDVVSLSGAMHVNVFDAGLDAVHASAQAKIKE